MSDESDGKGWAAALDIDALFEAKGVKRDGGERVRVLWRALAAEYATLALAAGETAEDAAAALATDAGDAAVNAAEIVRGVDARIALDDLDPRSGRGQADEDDETVDDVPWSAWRRAEDLAFKMMAVDEAENADRTVSALALGRLLAGFWARFTVDHGAPGSSPGQALPEVAAAAVRRHADGAAELAGDLVRRHRALHGGDDA